MNKRIKELVGQAFFETEYDDVQNLPETMERFAELILTEVIDILATYRMKAIFVDGIEYNCQHPIYAIQKHFGVK